MRIYIRESSAFARLASKKMGGGAIAIVYRNTIHLWGVSREEFMRSKTWVAHEVEHVRQFKQYGTAWFTCRYLWEWAKKGYYNNRFEVEARAAERHWQDLKNIEFV